MPPLRRALTWSFPLVIVLAFVCLGCASIAGGGSKQIIPLNSSPEAAYVVKQGATGMKIAEGTTPAKLTLARKNEYVVELTLSGYKTQTVAITKETNPWVWGNLVCGGIIGIIVDYSSGSAYKLEPEEISITMVTASIDGQVGTYAVFCKMDENGELRYMIVPMIATDGGV